MKLFKGLIFICFAHLAFGASVDPEVIQALKNQRQIEVIGLFHEPAPLTITDLKILNNRAFKSLLADLKSVKLREPLWISHAFVAIIDLKGLQELRQHKLVKKIYLNKKIKTQSQPDTNEESGNPYEPLIKLDVVRAHYSSYTGLNTTAAVIDTGVDGKHEFLKNNIQLFYSAKENQVKSEANDFSGHGTHVTGIIVKVAPDVKIVGVQIEDIKEALKAMAFLIDPDGTPQTEDQPRVVNNSWGEEDLPDLDLYYRALSVWQSKNIAAVFSAGNQGNTKNAVTLPKNHPSTIVVGAVDSDETLAPFSSRGPVIYKGRKLLKPELVAPGVKIYSTLPDNRWGLWSGTSMAAPMVTGTICLMLQSNPGLSPKDIQKILIESTLKRFDGWDPGFGYGILDTLSSLQKSMMWPTHQTIPLRALSANPPASPHVDLSFPKHLETNRWL